MSPLPSSPANHNIDNHILCSGSSEFERTGFTVLSSFASISDVTQIKQEITSLEDHGVLYLDQHGFPRRLEKFVKKSVLINSFSTKITSILFELFELKFNLFKDKVNYKPPGGEGFHAHYDGVFTVKTERSTYNGWYKYSDFFVNALIALDPFTVQNGCLEIADRHLADFETLLSNTHNDGSPNIKSSVLDACHFSPIIINPGDLVIFDSRCPHRSSVNSSNSDRLSLYLTYNPSHHGDFYETYFLDKSKSTSTFKALTGDLSV